jgi:very-short-patch-repair endonuclease
MHTADLQISRKRIGQIFRYLEALNQLRNPATTIIEEQPWHLWLRDLPSHESIAIGNAPTREDNAVDNKNGDDEYTLRVVRPQLRRVPEPSPKLTDWLEAGWDRFPGSISVRQSRNTMGQSGETVIEQFADDPDRVEALRRWSILREEWLKNETPARQAMRVFERLYELHGQLEREGERLEIVLGDGILSWRRPDGGVNHPILLQRLQLTFDPAIPQFLLQDTDHGPELYSALFRGMPDVDGRKIGKCREKLEGEYHHPLGGDDAAGFLRFLVQQLSADAEYIEGRPAIGMLDHPRMWRDPVVFVRTRSLGFANALDSIIEDIERREDFPRSLINIAWPAGDARTGSDDQSESRSKSEVQEVLFSKPANREQFQIAERLASEGCVLVQGPPGTGKTHTIANIIGDLLANGKSVLVTSHTTKALRVLREQVVPNLQPLCVSVLESDTASRKQLEASVGGIVHRLANENIALLQERARSLASARRELVARADAAKQQLVKARESEYRDIVIAGKCVAPSTAARLVRDGIGRHDWIPGPVQLGANIPLTDTEMAELYWTNGAVGVSDENEIAGDLPTIDELCTPSEFASMLRERGELTDADTTTGQELWRNSVTSEWLPRVIKLTEDAVKLFGEGTEDVWQIYVIAAGARGETASAVWQSLTALIGEVARHGQAAQESLLRYSPEFVSEVTDELLLSIDQITAHLNAGSSLNSWTLLTHPSWKKAVGVIKVGGKTPQTLEQFRAIKCVGHLFKMRKEMVDRWARQMQPIGAPTLENLGSPEVICQQFVPVINKCLEWRQAVWRPIEEEITAYFDWSALLQSILPVVSPNGDLLRLFEAAKAFVAACKARHRTLRMLAIDAILKGILRAVETKLATGSANVLIGLRDSIVARDVGAFRKWYERLLDLHRLTGLLKRRQALLAKMDSVAAGWAYAIQRRQPPNHLSQVPGDVHKAWLWRQFNDELNDRTGVSVSELQTTLDSLGVQLHQITAELTDAKAWSIQLSRTHPKQRQALMGWLDTVKRIGRGTGKRVPRLMAEARHLVVQSKSAVPVWIMPLSRVVENFDPARTRFDVVIIDEASQSDVMGLIAFYMADQVIVVGDHEQVSPEAVGQDLNQVQQRIDEHLAGIPNAHLYDGRLSVYDLARQAFGGLISLREHFRCVPEIIHFSNQLSYDWQIKPLRDPSSVRLRPHVIAHRVDGARSDDKTNPVEALEVASLVAACFEQPEYSGKTFGIISMLGDTQADLIERQLRSTISPTELASRRLLSGNAAQFQGDERDVVFLSMVDSPSDGPLLMRDDDRFRKRFNVAASRAKDQMWVVHSLNPESDLKPGDLRRRLIQYAQDPKGAMNNLADAERRVESEFEREVLKRLGGAGYRVRSQYEVGHYRIDLVVEGGGKRLAVECDGDRYHPLEKLADDMERQATLERLGWKFVRIRGSAFFRNPEKAMGPVFARLESMEIPREGPEVGLPATEHEESDLYYRVVRRAQEIRTVWQSSGDEDQELAPVIQGQAEAASYSTGQLSTGMAADAAPIAISQRFVWGPGSFQRVEQARGIDMDATGAEAVCEHVPPEANHRAQMVEYKRIAAELESRGWIVGRDGNNVAKVQHVGTRQSYEVDSTRLPADVREKAKRMCELQQLLNPQRGEDGDPRYSKQPN